MKFMHIYVKKSLKVNKIENPFLVNLAKQELTFKYNSNHFLCLYIDIFVYNHIFCFIFLYFVLFSSVDI